MPDKLLFLAIFEGPTPQEGVPILATEDEELVKAVAQALARRLGADHGVTQLLRLSNRGTPSDDLK